MFIVGGGVVFWLWGCVGIVCSVNRGSCFCLLYIIVG